MTAVKPPPRPPARRDAAPPVLPPPGGGERTAGAPPVWRTLSASMISMLLHLILMLALALILLSRPATTPPAVLVMRPISREEPSEELIFPEETEPVDVFALSSQPIQQIQADVLEDLPEIPVDTSPAAAAVDITLSEFAERTAPRDAMLQEVGVLAGEALEGRGKEMRGELVAKYGGTAESERAVGMALRWFARHQQQDGSWTLDLSHGTCKGECSQPGILGGCTTGATALALLPFLGAGNTHEQGEYKDNVMRGLRYLIRVQHRPSGDLSSGGGSLYSHGLATIALCEAYAMTQDQFLQLPAQASLNYISFAQDPRGGGWRYVPQQPGDTSVVGWQLMALKSGDMGYLDIPASTVVRVEKFLDRVQSDDGSMYGYNSRRPRPSTTAAGLLCRMYLGWQRDSAGIQKGIEHISRQGPAMNEVQTRYHMYYNYYATQVMRHYGGEEWKIWNEKLRDHLVRTQVSLGHMAGSWTIPEFENAAHDTEMGGRLYYTSLATMILEVYYRYLPIYTAAAMDEFPL